MERLGVTRRGLDLLGRFGWRVYAGPGLAGKGAAGMALLGRERLGEAG
jgi:hypothetical protein